MVQRSWRRHLLTIVIFVPLFALVWGKDIWGYFSDLRETAQLRTDACERMATLGFILPELQERCRTSLFIYQDGLAAAVIDQTSRIQAKLTADLDQLDTVTSAINAADFTPITMDAFLERHKNSKFPAQQADVIEPSKILLNAPWLMITGYLGVRVEDPQKNKPDRPKTAVGLSMDPALRSLRGGVLDRICRRTSSITLGCSGSVFMVVTEGILEPKYTVVGMQLAPIPPEQVFWTSFDMLRPPVSTGRNHIQAKYMQRFLDAFPENREAPSAPDGVLK